MRFFRDATHAPGNDPFCKPNIDRDFDSKPPINELGFADGFLEKSRFSLTKRKKFYSKCG